MTAEVLLQQAAAEGVRAFLLPDGKVRLRGSPAEVVTRWADVFREHKPEIVETLKSMSHCWHVTAPDGTSRTLHFSDSLTRAQVIEITGAVETEPAELPITPASEPLTPDAETAIRKALQAIGERDPAEIESVVTQCRIDAQARSYWLRRPIPAPRLVRCGNCRHFTRYDDHAHLGKCAIGGPENPAGNWDDDWRLCGLHQRDTA